MGKGRSSLVVCCNCGNRVPRVRAIEADRTRFFYSDTEGHKYYAGKIKLYYCRSCAKRRKIAKRSQQEKRRAQQHRRSDARS